MHRPIALWSREIRSPVEGRSTTLVSVHVVGLHGVDAWRLYGFGVLIPGSVLGQNSQDSDYMVALSESAFFRVSVSFCQILMVCRFGSVWWWL